MKQKRQLARLCAFVLSVVALVAGVVAVRVAADSGTPTSATLTSWDIFGATGGYDPSLASQATQNISSVVLDSAGLAGPAGAVWFSGLAGIDASPLPRLGVLDPATNAFKQWAPLADGQGGPALGLALDTISTTGRGSLWMTVQGDPFLVLKLPGEDAQGRSTFRIFSAPNAVTPEGVAVLKSGDAVVALPVIATVDGKTLMFVPRTPTNGAVTATLLRGISGEPKYVTVDANGDVWFTNPGNGTIGRVTPQPVGSRYPYTYWTLPSNLRPIGLQLVGGNVCFVTDQTPLGPENTGQAFCLDPNQDQLTEWTRPGGFNFSQQLTANSAGELFVTEARANGVSFVGRDAVPGTPVAAPHQTTAVQFGTRTLTVTEKTGVAPLSGPSTVTPSAPDPDTLQGTSDVNGHVRFTLPASPTESAVQPFGITNVINDTDANGVAKPGAGTVFVADYFDASLGRVAGGRIDRLTLTPASSPQIALSKSALTFDAIEGDTPPSAQSLTVADPNGRPVQWTATVDPGDHASWLILSPSAATLTVSVNHLSLAPGHYLAHVTVTDNNVAGLSALLTVTLNVDPRPAMTVTPTSLVFAGTVPPLVDSFTVTNTGGGTLRWTATMSPNLAQVAHLELTSGTVAGGQSSTVGVVVDAIKVLQDPGVITVTQVDANGNPIGAGATVSVSITGTTGVQTRVTPSVVNFTVPRGQTNPAPQTVTFENHVAGGVLWTVKNVPSWVTVTPTAAKSLENEFTPITISVKPDRMTLGTQTGTFVIVDQDGAHDSLPYGTVTINGSLVAPTIQASPAGLTFTTNQGVVAAGQTLTVKNTGTGSLTFTPVVTTASGGSWLTISPSGSTAIAAGGSATFTVTAGSASLAAATYSGSIAISDPSATNNPVVVPVTLKVNAAGHVTVNRTSVSFTTDHGTLPPPESIIVGNDGGAAYTYSAQAASDGGWLSIAAGASGTVNPGVPTTLTVAVNAAALGLAKGTYTGAITITAAGATNSPQTIPVTLTVRQAAAGASPTTLTFSTSRTRTPAAQTLSVTNTGDLTLAFTATAASDSGWLSVAPVLGSVSPGGSTAVTVSVNSASLAAGTYTGSVTITDPNALNSPVVVPVTLTVQPAATIAVAPPALTFAATQFGASPAAQTFTVMNSGDAPLTFTPAVALNNGAGWLSVSPAGPLTIAPGGQAQFTAAVPSTALAAGTYTGSIAVADTTATNSPQVVAVSLTVAPAAHIVLTPSQLSFAAEFGANPAAPQSVTLTNDGAAPLAFTAVSTTSFVSVSPLVGTVPAGGSTTLTVTVSSASLPIGLQTASIIVGDPAAANSPQTIGVAVDVRDTTPPNAPVVSLPDVSGANVTAVPLTISGEAGTTAAYTIASGASIVDGTASIGSSGSAVVTVNLSALPDGPLVTTVVLTDAANNTSAPGTNGSIKDVTPPAPPTVTLPTIKAANAGAVTLTITGEPNTTVNYTVIAGPITLTGTGSLDGSGSFMTTVNLTGAPDGNVVASATLTDAAGNAGAPGTHTAVKDATPPAITLPGPLQVPAASAAGATVTYTASATDNLQLVSFACAPPSGSLFPLGTSIVTCAASDGVGNTDTRTFSVTVFDSDAPVITVPSNITDPATSADGATVNYTVTAVDAIVGVVPVACSPASATVFPIGTTIVACTATDGTNAAAASFTVTVTPLPVARALINHAPTFNSSFVSGSVQVMLPETVTFNGNATLTGDLLMPGTPMLVKNGHPTLGAIIDGSGAATPTAHRLILNGGTTLGRLVRRTDAMALPLVAPPPMPSGTRSVTLNKASDNPGDFATIRNLTLNGKAGTRVLPAGTYGNLTVSGASKIVLGVAGATTPAVYNFQSLTLNGASRVEVVGPVVVTVRSDMSLGGSIGSPENPHWLTLRIAEGGLTLNGNVDVYGYVQAPAGTVTIGGGTSLTGGVAADDLTMNGSGRLTLLP
jgi:hypothetical protein